MAPSIGGQSVRARPGRDAGRRSHAGIIGDRRRQEARSNAHADADSSDDRRRARGAHRRLDDDIDEPSRRPGAPRGRRPADEDDDEDETRTRTAAAIRTGSTSPRPTRTTTRTSRPTAGATSTRRGWAGSRRTAPRGDQRDRLGQQRVLERADRRAAPRRRGRVRASRPRACRIIAPVSTPSSTKCTVTPKTFTP